jgi:hypothetical protein
MMDYLLLAIGLLVVLSCGASAYGYFFLRDAVEEVTRQIGALAALIRAIPPPADVSSLPEIDRQMRTLLEQTHVLLRQHQEPPPPPADPSVMEAVNRRMGLLLAMVKSVFAKREKAAIAAEPPLRATVPPSERPGRQLARRVRDAQRARGLP